MSRRSCELSLCAIALLLLQVHTPAEDTRKEAEPSAAVAAAGAHVSDFKVTTVVDGSPTDVELLANPLLTYGDAARNNEAGTLWAWGKSGRPAAFLELYRNVGENQPWVHALTLTSPELVRLSSPSGHRWNPQKTHFALKDLPKPSDVSDQPAMRLRQMKDISRRFEAHEFWDPNNSRFELRLLVQPVHRYKDESAKLLDGAVFVLAHGTNPEVLLQIEAHSTQAQPVWKYSLARLGSAELHVLLDGQEVWTEPRTPGIAGQPVDPYWLFFIR